MSSPKPPTSALPGKNLILLKWNDFESVLPKQLASLYGKEELTDVTLVSDTQSFKAHRVILAMWSPYFRDVFLNNPCPHPVVILKDVTKQDMEHLLSFIYQGELFIKKEETKRFLSIAKSLHILGVTEMELYTAAVITGDEDANAPQVIDIAPETRPDDSTPNTNAQAPSEIQTMPPPAPALPTPNNEGVETSKSNFANILLSLHKNNGKDACAGVRQNRISTAHEPRGVDWDMSMGMDPAPSQTQMYPMQPMDTMTTTEPGPSRAQVPAQSYYDCPGPDCPVPAMLYSFNERQVVPVQSYADNYSQLTSNLLIEAPYETPSPYTDAVMEASGSSNSGTAVPEPGPSTSSVTHVKLEAMDLEAVGSGYLIPCSVCGKRVRQTSLRVHMRRTHLDEGLVLKCPVCSKLIKSKGIYYKHMHMHRKLGQVLPSTSSFKALRSNMYRVHT